MESIVGAAANISGRKERLEEEEMAKEARRLKFHAAYENNIAIAMGQRHFDHAHMQKDVETDEEQTEGESGDDPLPYLDVSTREKYDQLAKRLTGSGSSSTE